MASGWGEVGECVEEWRLGKRVEVRGNMGGEDGRTCESGCVEGEGGGVGGGGGHTDRDSGWAFRVHVEEQECP